MATAVITLVDVGDELQAKIEYEGGYDIESPAQAYGLLLMKHLNTLLEPTTDEVIVGGAPSAARDESYRSAYWKDKTDPMGKTHGKDKFDKLNVLHIAAQFLLWSASRPKDDDLTVEKVKSMIDPKSEWLDVEINEVLDSLKRFDVDARKNHADMRMRGIE